MALSPDRHAGLLSRKAAGPAQGDATFSERA